MHRSRVHPVSCYQVTCKGIVYTFLVMTIYEKDARLYDLIYGGDDAEALAFVRWLLKYLDLSQTDPILDMGAGTGSLLIPLTEDGYKISGMEPYTPMREYAITKSQLADTSIDIVEGSFQQLDIEERYRLIMAINGPLHYVQPDELHDVFENLANALHEGGYLVLDTINFLSIIKNYQHPEPMEFELDGTHATAMIQHFVDLDREKWTNRVILFYKDQEYHRFEDNQEMSMFTRTHLETVAKHYGLEFIHFFSSYKDRPKNREYGGRLITVFKKG